MGLISKMENGRVELGGQGYLSRVRGGPVFEAERTQPGVRSFRWGASSKPGPPH